MAHRAAVRIWTSAFGQTPGEWTISVIEPESDASKPARDGALETLDDAALVAESLAGRKEAFDVIVERHQRSVYQVCYRFAGNHEDAADFAQESFVRAWRGLKGFKGNSALPTWLYRIAVNVCLNKVGTRRPTTEPLEADRFVDTRTEDPRSGLMREERGVAVRRAIAQLPDRQRATLILRAYHELSHQEIADILGSSVGAVKANFFHALANLKKILGSEP